MKTSLVLLLLCASATVLASSNEPQPKPADHHGEDHHGAVEVQGRLDLDPALRELLKQEMQQIKAGMESLVLANVAGNWGKIAAVGQQIKQSYIMKQKLTEQQRHQLHQGLPPEFQQLDQKLHHYAGMLAHMAHEHDSELVNFYLYKMNETCTSCHAQFASDTFVGFKQKNNHQ